MKNALAIVAVSFVCACTPAAQQTASQITQGAEVVCVLVTDVMNPAVEPLCVAADELAKAVESFIAAHAGQLPAVVSQPSTNSMLLEHEVFTTLAKNPKVTARKLAAKRCGK